MMSSTEGERPKVGVGVIVLREGEILLGERISTLGSNTFSLPGGHVEFGESFEAAALREVKEETGLTNLRMKGVVSLSNDISYGKHYITVGLLAELLEGEPKVCERDRFKSWEWFSLQDLPSPLFLPSKKVIQNWQKEVLYSDGEGGVVA